MWEAFFTFLLMKFLNSQLLQANNFIDLFAVWILRFLKARTQGATFLETLLGCHAMQFVARNVAKVELDSTCATVARNVTRKVAPCVLASLTH